jgi:SAM-dependent methyltransferase
MPRVSCVVFAGKSLLPEIVKGKRVIDVGACDFNGSVRPLIEAYVPSEYIGIDMIPGPSVDRVINANDLAQAYGPESFDIVICMETMEHSRYWRKTLSNIKMILKPGGYLVLTAPAPGYCYHGHPTDFWRYTPEDFKNLLSDFEIINTEYDKDGPGSFIFARKPESNFQQNDLSQYPLFSILTGSKIVELIPSHYRTGYYYRLITKHYLKTATEWTFHALGRLVTRIFKIR